MSMIILYIYIVSQNGFSFDHIYAWEYTEIKPAEYWKTVPRKLVPYLSFYNVPVSKDANSSSSVINTIESIAHKEDFVTLKLDIDTSDIELPILADMLRRPGVASLIDEFFFEFHFRCEIMTKWWNIPLNETTPIHGFELDRPHVMDVFQKLRYMGIRSHFWT